MAWINPIIDRTQSDVNYIINLKNAIIDIGWENATVEQVFNWLSSDTDLLKGSLKYTDLNRIENNIDYLYSLLSSYGYSFTITTRGTWTANEVVKLSDIDRIKQNIINMVDAFVELTGSPTLTLGQDYINFTIANDIETLIYNTNYLLELMIGSFRYSGTYYYSGTDFEL